MRLFGVDRKPQDPPGSTGSERALGRSTRQGTGLPRSCTTFSDGRAFTIPIPDRMILGGFVRLPSTNHPLKKFDDFTAIRLDLGSFTDDRGTFVASLGIVYSGKARPEELRSRVNLHIYRYGQTWEFLLEHQPPKKMRLGMLLGRAQGSNK